MYYLTVSFNVFNLVDVSYDCSGIIELECEENCIADNKIIEKELTTNIVERMIEVANERNGIVTLETIEFKNENDIVNFVKIEPFAVKPEEKHQFFITVETVKEDEKSGFENLKLSTIIESPSEKIDLESLTEFVNENFKEDNMSELTITNLTRLN